MIRVLTPAGEMTVNVLHPVTMASAEEACIIHRLIPTFAQALQYMAIKSASTTGLSIITAR